MGCLCPARSVIDSHWIRIELIRTLITKNDYVLNRIEIVPQISIIPIYTEASHS